MHDVITWPMPQGSGPPVPMAGLPKAAIGHKRLRSAGFCLVVPAGYAAAGAPPTSWSAPGGWPLPSRAWLEHTLPWRAYCPGRCDALVCDCPDVQGNARRAARKRLRDRLAFRMPRSRPSIVRTRPRARFTSSLADSRTAPLSSMADPTAPASSGRVAMSCKRCRMTQGAREGASGLFVCVRTPSISRAAC